MANLLAIPVYNEERAIAGVLSRSLAYPLDLFVVDDGSTDRTPDVLRQFPQISLLRHNRNRGYGAALRAAMHYAIQNHYDVLVTMDADGQHDPEWIPRFLAVAHNADIVSGSRYLGQFPTDTPAPMERRRINSLVTDELNACFGLDITDAFCGFKAYRCAALSRLTLTEDGYAMPLELWVEAACLGLQVREIAVPRVYLDPTRSFGDQLDDANARLAYYQRVIDRTVARRKGKNDCHIAGHPHPVFPRLELSE